MKEYGLGGEGRNPAPSTGQSSLVAYHFKLPTLPHSQRFANRKLMIFEDRNVSLHAALILARGW